MGSAKSIAVKEAAAPRPTWAEAEEAVRALLRWAGDDPAREGLRDTPARVARAYEEFFSGNVDDPVAILKRTFTETDGYDEIVLLPFRRLAQARDGSRNTRSRYFEGGAASILSDPNGSWGAALGAGWHLSMRDRLSVEAGGRITVRKPCKAVSMTRALTSEAYTA